MVGSSSYSINGEPVTVGDFKLTAINEEDIVVGCHRIKWEEIMRFASTQGWAPIRPSVNDPLLSSFYSGN